jgi:proteasome lid subunit RPN8/RPN11
VNKESIRFSTYSSFLFDSRCEAEAKVILRLVHQQLGCLENEARRVFPVEACALLFGKLVRNEATVERIVVTPNIVKSATSFEIDSRTFCDAFIEADKDGLSFLGFFHSHPAAATPSSVDLTFMRLWGDAVWIIFSLTENRFAAFRMKKGKACAVTLKIEGKD